ncbi:hypothetical protein TWF694_005236 [Orbilia ellipsospora]|uniref:Uncharacterized protein n=1 Tax=Orbilia ellipsospora TaxID=2528407 RepID=A0AAV9WSK9_9PEZI
MAFPSPPPFPNTWTWPSSCQETHWTDNGKSCTSDCDIYQIFTTESTLSYSCLPPGYLETTNSWTWYGTWAPGYCPAGFTTATQSDYTVRGSAVGVAICCADGYTFAPGALSCGSSYTTSITVFGSTRQGEARRTTVVGPGEKHMQAYTLWSTYGQAIAGTPPRTATASNTGSTTNSATSTTSTIPTNGDTGGGLSTGAKAGIGVGAAIGALLIAVLFFLLGKRRRVRSSPSEENQATGVPEIHGDSARQELDAKGQEKQYAELHSPGAGKWNNQYSHELGTSTGGNMPYRHELGAEPQNQGQWTYPANSVQPVEMPGTYPYYDQSRAMPYGSYPPGAANGINQAQS